MRRFWRRLLSGLFIVFAGLTILSSLLFFRRYPALPPSAINLIDPVSEPTASDRVLVVSPHPDDETLGACGFLLRAQAAGAQRFVVVVTDGNKRGKEAIRKAEVEAATEQCGVPADHLTRLGFPDGKLAAVGEHAVAERLRPLLTELQPTIVLTTDPSDIHRDHAITSAAVNQALGELHGPVTVYGFLIHYHRYPRPEGFQPDAPLLPPAVLVDENHLWRILALTQGEQSKKKVAIQTYRSQLKTPFLRGLMLSFVRANELFSLHRVGD